MIPLDLAFEPQALKNIYYIRFDLAVDILFILDIILMFMTSFQDRKGREELDSFVIACRYMSSYRFFTDVLSILGIGPITNLVPVFKIFGVFKTIRVLRLSEYISKLNLHSLTKSVLNLIKLIIYLSLFLHMIACIWYMTVKQNADKFDETGRSL